VRSAAEVPDEVRRVPRIPSEAPPPLPGHVAERQEKAKGPNTPEKEER
jgi:hypothetical protein